MVEPFNPVGCIRGYACRIFSNFSLKHLDCFLVNVSVKLIFCSRYIVSIHVSQYASHSSSVSKPQNCGSSPEKMSVLNALATQLRILVERLNGYTSKVET